MPYFRATVELFIEAEDDSQACDLMSALLTENGIYHGDEMLRDWMYSETPHEVDAADDETGHEEYFASGDPLKGRIMVKEIA